MWVGQVTDQRLAEFPNTHQQTLGIGGKGCESASPQESIEAEKDVKSGRYFAEPGEADWGC